MTILHVNNFNTTLNGSITNSQTTMVVTSASGGPAVGSGANAYLTIQSGSTYEIVLATAVSTNTYTITRGQQGTSGTAFSSGANVFQSDTASDFDSINTPNDALINGLTVGLGHSSIATNTSLGNAANAAISTGSHCTSVGYQAGTAVTTGADNTAFGYQAGFKATSQSGNTSIGSKSGNQSASTQQATMVGYQAGAACSSQDTAMGYNALLAGSGDAFGYNVLNASSGSQNVGMGNGTLSGSSYSGSQSTAVGCNSGSSLTSGGTNTFLGYQTGFSAASGSTALTTGNGNTLIGYQASCNSAAAVGTIALGKNAVSDVSTGSTSGTNGPGIAIGSSGSKVGFRGDGTIYPSGSTGAAGFWRIKINGTYYQVPAYTDGQTSIWQPITTSQTAATGSFYVANSGSLISVTLPATAAVGDIVGVVGLGAGSWKIIANTGQTIKGLGTTTTSAGNITCANQYDTIQIICIVANTTWSVLSYCSTALTFA